jgi:exodeoxyribonuclease VII small subunit
MSSDASSLHLSRLAHAPDARDAAGRTAPSPSTDAPDVASRAGDGTPEADRPPLEHSMRTLEEIVERLENDPPDLESAIDAYEKGVAIARDCLRRLEQAEQRVTELSLRGE